MLEQQTPRYSIIFDGELIDGVSRKTALDKLAHLTNLTEDELLDALFSVRPVIAAQTNHYQLADQFREQFRQAGLKVSTLAYDQSHDDIVNADLSFGHYAPRETQHSAPNFLIDTPATASLQESNIHQPKGKYHVTFNGVLQNGFNRKQVMANLRLLTNSPEQDVLENIFSAVPVIFCQTNNPGLAKTYQNCFEQAGLDVDLSSDERLSNPEIAARSYLLIRDDKPSPLPAKKIQRFTYTLYGLAGLACLCWIAVYMVIDSYLRKDVEQSIQVQLVQVKAIEKIAVKKIAPEPVKKTKGVEKKPAKKKASKLIEEQKKETKPPAPPEKKAVTANEQKSVKEKKEDKEQQRLKKEYNLQLLNWLAMFQQQNQLESKYAEGEITLRLSISRDGEVKKIEVLKSTSEELQRAVVMQLRKATTVPGIPIKITGSEYSFDLPLRYRFN